MVEHTGIKANSYQQYLKWGSIAHPLRTAVATFANWIFWLAVFYAIGGLYLTAALLTGAFIWGLALEPSITKGMPKEKINRWPDWTLTQKTSLSISGGLAW